MIQFRDFPSTAFDAAIANDASWLENHATEKDACASFFRIGDARPFSLLEVSLYVPDSHGAVKSGKALDAMDATALWLLRQAHGAQGDVALNRGLFSDGQSPMARCCAMLCLRSTIFLMEQGQSCFRPMSPRSEDQSEMWSIGSLLERSPENADRARAMRDMMKVAHAAQVARSVLAEIQTIDSLSKTRETSAGFR